MFDALMEQDEFVQKQRERALQEGKIEAFQTILADIVKYKFPSLEDLAQKRATQMRQVDALREVIRLVNAISDENIARAILNPSAA
ncbi:MAG: hypothetical protein NVS4B11_30480 [Ktedonobacteraceae bacterium]